MSVEIRVCDLFIYWPFYEFLHGNGFVKTNIRRDAEQLRPLPAGSAVALTAENKFRKKNNTERSKKTSPTILFSLRNDFKERAEN